jgi:ubiquinol-cytochrome c reductase cytochrome c1 subunit
MARIAAPLAALAGALGLVASAALADTTQEAPKSVHWSFEGPFGRYDQEQLQRGYKVYREVCSSCHSMNMVAFRNLGDRGGPFWDPKYPNPNDNPVVKTIAKDYQIADIDSDTGDTIKRPGVTADYLPNPYANEAAGRGANGGALPPDMSLLAKAREGGPAYIYSIVTGDTAAAPHGLVLPAGKYYDPYIAGDLSGSWHGDPHNVPEGGVVAMPPPLTANRVTFDDGTKATLNQEAYDVAAFLEWAADPKMEERKEAGVGVMIFLLLFAGVLWMSYRAVWKDVGH